jgi:hypothetical protein
MSNIEDLKIVLREADIPFFTDEQLDFYLRENGGNYDLTAYQCLLIKAEDTTLQVSGLSAADSSKYFRRLAAKYRPNNSGILKGAF